MAQQTITIRVNGKRAETDFGDLVSFNENSYRLHFEFDSEWDSYSNRVAVVLWAGGCREKLFTGTECDMPAVSSPDCDTALVGVYSADGAGKRIASSFVRLRCLAGAYCEPEEAPQKTLHEQILDLLNEYDFSALEEKVTPGSYSAVDVNAYGFVTGGKQIVEVGGVGQTQPSASLADGGIFFRKEEDGFTLCYYEDGSLVPITGIGGGEGGAVSSVNGQTGAVTISKYDLGLADVAISGSYNDLEDLPAPAAVTSVNGQTGAVTISKNDLGLADVALSGSYNDLEDLPAPAAVTSVNGQTGAVTISKNDLGLADVALSGSYNDLEDLPAPAAVTSVNGQTGAVTISKNDLGLADVAISGSYNDLLDKPTAVGGGAVSSVNGQTGAVTISKYDLGLADVAISGSYNDLEDLPAPAAVTSVNGQTGAVTISKNDLGLAEVALSGSYNDLEDLPDPAAVTSVNGQTGAVTISKNDLGLAEVAISGSYNDLLDKPTAVGGGAVSSVNGQTGAVTISKYDLGLADVAISGSYNDLLDKPTAVGGGAVSSVNGQTGDVVISKDDLGLAAVALTGSYNDLLDKPTSAGGGGGVTSVNGQTGAVTISKNDLGLGLVENERQLAISDLVHYGANFNTLDDTGCYFVQGSSALPCSNAPTSEQNSSTNCQWFVMTFSHVDAGQYVTQLAISEKSDCAIRIRNRTNNSWGSWKTVV